MEKWTQFISLFMLVIIVTAGCTAKAAPPVPKVTAEQITIPVTQSSYCWGSLGCADYAGAKKMLEGKTPIVVPSGADIQVAFDYKPAPSGVTLRQSLDGQSLDIPLKDGAFTAPREKGIYYYSIFAYWTSKDGMFSKGDTSSVFLIEVK